MTTNGATARRSSWRSLRAEGDGPHRITRAELGELVAGLCDGSRRRLVGLVGLVGPPGSGKSRLATRLAEALCPMPPVVPMDGFHLPQAVIDAKGLADRKGSPEPFDAWGFVNLVTRLANPPAGVVDAPRFDRSIEEPVAGAIPVRPADRLVITEGNYLLLEESPWDRIRPALDLCAYLELDDATRVRRLVERHVRFGRPRPEAERFVRDSDERNAELVKATRIHADVVVLMDP